MKKELSKLRAFGSLRKQAELAVNRLQEQASEMMQEDGRIKQRMAILLQQERDFELGYSESLRRGAMGSELTLYAGAREDMQKQQRSLQEAQKLLEGKRRALLKQQMEAQQKLDSVERNITAQQQLIERIRENRSEEEMQDMFSSRQIFIKR
ncbi:MAG: hypothetical protein HQM07_01670 [Zetaproteobacteria bacterium]|nr:hypothetical protein [Zetaproteobacteria bacterium]